MMQLKWFCKKYHLQRNVKQKAEKEKKNMEINVVKKEVPEKMKHVHAKERVTSKKIPQVSKCAICDLQFSCKQNVKMHLESAHTVHKYVCRQCGKEYGRPQTLQGHVKTVHKDFRFKCTKKYCNEEFTQKDQLNVHMLEHEGKFKFAHNAQKDTITKAVSKVI